MFERYTEAARKAIFFGRYEASQFGSAYIEPEHLLLGLLRVAGEVIARVLPPASIESLRIKLEQQPRKAEAATTSVGLPLSHEMKRVLAYASKESERLQHKHIGVEHLLIGIARERDCLAARLLREHGVKLPALRQEADQAETSAGPGLRLDSTWFSENCRDLIALAQQGGLGPCVGREAELERLVQILSRRTRYNPVLVGEPGVGKTAILHGLAQRIFDGAVSTLLCSRKLLLVDAGALAPARHPLRTDDRLQEVLAVARGGTVLCIDGLFDLRATASWSAVEPMHLLETALGRGELHVIATGTPAGLQAAMQKAELLACHFEIVRVAPPDEQDAVSMVQVHQPQYERFHGVRIAPGTVEAAVRVSGFFLKDRCLPERALDLIDEASARAKLRLEWEPKEITETRRRIRKHSHAMEHAIGAHEFEQVRLHSDEEQRERKNLERLRERRATDQETSATVTPNDIEETVAARLGAPIVLIHGILDQKPQPPDAHAALAAAVPETDREWLPFLEAYLDRCSKEDAEKLAKAIQAAKEA